MVEIDDFARDRRVDVRYGFHRLHRADGFSLIHVLAGFQGLSAVLEVHVDDIAQFVLGVIRDADGARIAFHVHPLVFLGVPVIFGIHYLAGLENGVSTVTAATGWLRMTTSMARPMRASATGK